MHRRNNDLRSHKVSGVRSKVHLLPATVLLIGLSLLPGAALPQLHFTHLSNEQGLSNSTIEAIYQDSRGFIWLGTRDGLNRYDGHEIVVYRNDAADTASLSDSYVRCIYEDHEQQLWVGTINGLNRLDREKNNFTRFRHHAGDPNSLSHNLVTSLAEDRNGQLWVGTFGGGLDLYHKDSHHFTAYGISSPHDGAFPLHDRINTLLVDRTGNLWVGAYTGLSLFHPADGRFTDYPNHQLTNTSGNIITALREGREGNLWVGTENDGLFLFDARQNSFSRYGHSDKDPASLGNDMVKSLLVDQKGSLWVGTVNGGLNLFDPAKGSFLHYQYEPGNSFSLSQRTISALSEDRQGNCWIGTHRGGVNIYSPGREKFGLYRQESSPASLSYHDVRAFCEDRDGGVWVGTDGGGLDLFLRDRQTFRHYRYDPFRKNSLGADAVLDVMQDREGRIWVSTWGGGLNRLDKTSGLFTRYLNDPRDSNSVSSDFVQKTIEDGQGRLWVATYYGGLNLLDPKTGKFTRLLQDPSGRTALTGKNIVSLLEDKEGRIWIGTDDGGLNSYDQTTRHFTHYFHNEERVPDLRVLFQDSKGRLFVGQKGLFLFDAGRDTFRLYTDKAGLADEFIKGITEDGQGNYWIATSNGITQLNAETGTFKKFNTGDGLQGLEFEANACMKTRDGEMYFGGVNGFNCFYPGTIRANPFVPPVYITGFQLFNQKIVSGTTGSPLQKDISLAKEIRLSYRQSTFSFTFAALNYTVPENNQYAYRLEGLDKDWNYVGREKKAAYTNLDPGEYTFRVKASNNDGVWNEEGASVKILITPPFWKTAWFDGLLAALVLAGLVFFYKFKTRLELQALEERKREEIHQVQLQFFTNISHEFRTPLSLILGPLEKLMKEDIRPAVSQFYATMHRNAQRLLSLIDELMDFGKLESGALKLTAMKGSLPSFLKEIAEEFHDWAEQKEIDFRLGSPVGGSLAEADKMPDADSMGAGLPGRSRAGGSLPGDTWFDRQVLEKILLNLLHNSFKYTRPGGHITLELLPDLTAFTPSFANELILKNDFRGKAYAYIRVADSGIGISKESIRHLFERYYRITDSHLGSGLGLAFVKSLALLHKGDVFVYSERLKGTEIIIGLPVDESDYKKEEKGTAGFAAGGVRLEGFITGNDARRSPGSDARDPSEKDRPIKGSNEAALVLPYRGPKESILLVEDNEELRQFLKESLAPYYTIMEAADGREGLARAKEASPNLIISDVIMPGMNGIDFCRAVKDDIDTSHIPFLMLTARSALVSQLEGLDSGADYYFSKPLNMELLLLTIRNRLDQGWKLKERYTRESHIEAMELVHSEKDKEFMTRLLAVIDSQMVDPDFDIDALCIGMGMSRTRLYQKIRSISQQSIGDFIRTIRLKKAMQIMTHEDVSLTEVMVRIGIQTQSHFTKAFKKEFNKTPTQFMQEIRNDMGQHP